MRTQYPKIAYLADRIGWPQPVHPALRVLLDNKIEASHLKPGHKSFNEAAWAANNVLRAIDAMPVQEQSRRFRPWMKMMPKEWRDELKGYWNKDPKSELGLTRTLLEFKVPPISPRYRVMKSGGAFRKEYSGIFFGKAVTGTVFLTFNGGFFWVRNAAILIPNINTRQEVRLAFSIDESTFLQKCMEGKHVAPHEIRQWA